MIKNKKFQISIFLLLILLTSTLPVFAEVELYTMLGIRNLTTFSSEPSTDDRYYKNATSLSLDIQVVFAKFFNAHVYYSFPSFNNTAYYYAAIPPSNVNENPQNITPGTNSIEPLAFINVHAISVGLGYYNSVSNIAKKLGKIDFAFSVGPAALLYWYRGDYIRAIVATTPTDDNYQAYQDMVFSVGAEISGNVVFPITKTAKVILGVNVGTFYAIHDSEYKTSSKILIRDNIVVNTGLNAGFRFTF